MRRAGFVLVGGKSSRMGRDKALLPFGDGTLAESVAKVAEASTGQVFLIGDPARYGQLGFPVYPDLTPGLGPLSGLQTALSLGKADWNLVVACDMPRIFPAFLDHLFHEAVHAWPDRDCIVPLTRDGRIQPLCAVYHSSCLSRINEAIQANRLRVLDLIAEMRPLEVRWPDARTLLSANTPEDWAALQSPAQ